MTSPNTCVVSLSAVRIGVPVNAIIVALGEGVTQMPGVAVEVVVVAAVSLIHDDDDVAPVRQQRVRCAGVLLGLGLTELLQGREVDAAGPAVGELGAQLIPAGQRDRLLWQ